MSSSTYEELKTKLTKANQEQLLWFWPDLTDDEKKALQAQLESLNFEDMNKMFERAIADLSGDVQKLDERMKPVPHTRFESEERSTPKQLERYRMIGLEEISKGHVAALLLAGGQGTRLGVSHPKGMYCLNLPSKKTLFQIQAERIKRLQQLAKMHCDGGAAITWYIMTSGPTEAATREFLKSNQYFGLEPENVVLFKQGLLPSFDMDGRVLLQDKHSLALSPDGNGGVYRSLQDNGILEDMRMRGVQYVHAYSVDNILVKVCDPVFVGYCIDKKADCGAKVVQKSSPSEAVGVICQVDGHFQVVEYSEITEATANLRNPDDTLVFNAGNICNHFFSTDFLQEVAERHEKKLNLHVAKKKIVHVNQSGEKITPTTPNGIKIEKFIFDVFQFSDHFVTWEVPRKSEFSGLKNGDQVGKDCPSTARKDLFFLHKKYVEAAGGKVEGDIVEISPLLSYAGENLEDKVKGHTFYSPVLLTSDNEIDITLNGIN